MTTFNMSKARLFLGLCAAALSPVMAQAGTVTKAPYGTTAAGEAVSIYTLTNDRGMVVKILSFGGVINEVDVPDRNGTMGDIMLTLPDLKAYEGRPNFSSIVGRVVGRIAQGGFTLDGKRYDLPSNPSGISTHGGAKNFSTKVWSVKVLHDKSLKKHKEIGLSLSYTSPDGEMGFPGNLKTTVRYVLDNDNRLTLTYEATTDKPTVVNLTNHGFINLAGSGTVKNQVVTLFAHTYTPLTALKIPTGEIAPVAGTLYDLTQPTPLSKALDAHDPQIDAAKGFDTSYIIDKPMGDSQNALAPAAFIKDPTSGRTLLVRTTEPGMVFYSGGGLDGTLKDKQGNALVRFAGLAVETQHYPDSPNHDNFPSIVLRPGQKFHSVTSFQFGVAGS